MLRVFPPSRSEKCPTRSGILTRSLTQLLFMSQAAASTNIFFHVPAPYGHGNNASSPPQLARTRSALGQACLIAPPRQAGRKDVARVHFGMEALLPRTRPLGPAVVIATRDLLHSHCHCKSCVTRCRRSFAICGDDFPLDTRAAGRLSRTAGIVCLQTNRSPRR